MYRSLVLSLLMFKTVFCLSISHHDASIIADRIWANECNKSIDGLTTWNKGENFPSLGIGHFIWYKNGEEEKFEETFPSLIAYMTSKGAHIPDWLKNSPSCPWKSREDFLSKFEERETKQLRQFLFETRHLQAAFIANRLEKTFHTILEKLSGKDRKKISDLFYSLSESPKGLYALIDYLNFKGSGINPNETYQGKGWGLYQVLTEMKNDSLSEFVRSGKKVLSQRIENSPTERNEKRWLKGWCNRLDTYLK